MKVPLSLGLVALALSLPIAAWVWRSTPAPNIEPAAPREAPSSIHDATPQPADFGHLQKKLENERRARAALEERIGVLEVRLDASPPPPKPSGPTAHPADSPVRVPARPFTRGIQPEALAELGASEAEAVLLQERWNQWELDRLYAQNQASREDYADTPRYRDEVRDLRDNLQHDIGDEDFDRLLYAAGQGNRVVVHGVIPESPAAAAGLESGDIVISYGGKRVYNPIELKQLTAEGRVGQRTAIEVDRGGTSIRYYLPRGPMGLQMRSMRIRPE